MTTRQQGPRPVGPIVAGLTVRERAVAAYEAEALEARRKAERAARSLARSVLGVPDVEFDDFIPEDFARRHGFEPKDLVTFELEGLHFNYGAPYQHRGRTISESLNLVDRCPCGGVRILVAFRSLADLGLGYATRDLDAVKCADCRGSKPMSSNAATNVLAQALVGISQANRNLDPDPEAPDLAADFVPLGEHGVEARVELPSGDRYRISVEWLSGESP